MTQRCDHKSVFPRSPVPPWVGRHAERIVAAKGQPERLQRVFETSLVPMVIVDDARRYVEVNVSARLWFRLGLAELRKRRVGDLSPPERLGLIDDAWGRLMQTGCIAGTIQADSLDGDPFEITYYAMRHVLPERHLVAFAPSEWLERTPFRESERPQRATPPSLTAREVEVLELAAEGQSAPAIAERLVLSPATVRTHLEHIYNKLGVHDRAGAVATAMRLGLIA